MLVVVVNVLLGDVSKISEVSIEVVGKSSMRLGG